MHLLVIIIALRKVIASVITSSLSPDVITTPSGIPPADVHVLIIKVGQLYLSRLLVESQYTSSPACFTS